ncbi:MAG TPA: rhodanese-like domain-containing protein, partial [Solirubrobacteraceae bacterium]
DAGAAAKLATAVGIRKLGGFLHGGMTSWREEGHAVARIERLPARELPVRAQADPDLQVLDVRERDEWDAGHLPGSVHTPYHDVTAVPEGLDPARPIAVICGSGPRAAVAASLVARHGAAQVIHVTPGGVPALVRAGHPIEKPEQRVAVVAS